MAAPVAGKIFAEVLPYLNIKKADEENKAQIKVPDLKGKTIKEAEKILKENNIENNVYRRTGFRINVSSLAFEGVCSSCADEKDK